MGKISQHSTQASDLKRDTRKHTRRLLINTEHVCDFLVIYFLPWVGTWTHFWPKSEAFAAFRRKMTNAQNHTAGIDWAISICADTSSREQHEIWAPGDAYFCVELASFLFVYLLVCFLSQSSQLFSQWASIRPEESIDIPKFDVYRLRCHV